MTYDGLGFDLLADALEPVGLRVGQAVLRVDLRDRAVDALRVRDERGAERRLADVATNAAAISSAF